MVELVHEKIPIHDLIPGMYVSRLDRPWIGTPFPIQGFHIKTESDVEELQRYCQYVYIDGRRSQVRQRQAPEHSSTVVSTPIRIDETIYRRSRPMKDEVVRAARLHTDVARTIEHIVEQVGDGQSPDIPKTRRTATEMVESVAANPAALIWVRQLTLHDAHQYAHAIRMAIWAIAFGRHLGMGRTMLQELALGMLLADIGLLNVPSEILSKEADELDSQERSLLQSHVAHSLERLKGTRGLGKNTLELIATHHERHNGSGYPRRLRGEQIPLMGRIAGIVDTYDDLTNPRRKSRVRSPGDAIVELHRERYEGFQGELIDEFIQAIGIYPTGSLVEFKSGEVGIICEQNEGWRLRPRVMLLLDADKRPCRPREVDLLDEDDDLAGRLEIQRGLPDGSHDIDLGKLRARRIDRLLGRGNSLLIH